VRPICAIVEHLALHCDSHNVLGVNTENFTKLQEAATDNANSSTLSAQFVVKRSNKSIKSSSTRIEQIPPRFPMDQTIKN